MATTTLMSFAEFERLDVGADKAELLKGELIRVPPAGRRHNTNSDEIFLKIHLALAQSRACAGMIVGREMGYFVSREHDTWLQPDVSITHPNQATEPGRSGEDDYYIGAPLLVLEMVSPSDSAMALQEKIAEYLAHGAAEVWVL